MIEKKALVRTQKRCVHFLPAVKINETEAGNFELFHLRRMLVHHCIQRFDRNIKSFYFVNDRLEKNANKKRFPNAFHRHEIRHADL